MSFNVYKRKKISVMISTVLLFIVILPVLIATFYAIPSADDFTNALDYISYDTGLFRSMIIFMIDMYKGWQGTYSGVFLAAVPTYYKFGLLGLRLELFFNAILFFVAIWRAILSVINRLEIKQKKSYGLILYAIMIFYLFIMADISEMFYWHTCVCVYTIPLTCSFLAISCFLNYTIKSKKNRELILGCIFAGIGAGGALNISAFLCAVLLFFILYNYFVVGKIDKNVFIGVFALLGSLVNVVAPGNYIRHEHFDSKLRVFKSINEGVDRINGILKGELLSGFLLMVIVISFILGLIIFKDYKIKLRYPVIVIVYAYLGVLITDFPVILGTAGPVMEPRGVFIERVSIAFFVMLASLYCGGWIIQRYKFVLPKRWSIFIVATSLLFIMYGISGKNIMELTPIKMSCHLLKGSFHNISSKQESIIEQIENAKEKNVVVYIEKDKDEEWANIKTIGLTEDVEHWINYALAIYYDKDTICIKYINE